MIAIAEAIKDKQQQNYPVLASANTVKQYVTDRDNFPYTRYYRGQLTSNPRVYEREAGYRPLMNQYYQFTSNVGLKDNTPNTCFELPCSTVLPCVPKDLKRKVRLRKGCIVTQP